MFQPTPPKDKNFILCHYNAITTPKKCIIGIQQDRLISSGLFWCPKYGTALLPGFESCPCLPLPCSECKACLGDCQVWRLCWALSPSGSGPWQLMPSHTSRIESTIPHPYWPDHSEADALWTWPVAMLQLTTAIWNGKWRCNRLGHTPFQFVLCASCYQEKWLLATPWTWISLIFMSEESCSQKWSAFQFLIKGKGNALDEQRSNCQRCGGIGLLWLELFAYVTSQAKPASSNRAREPNSLIQGPSAVTIMHHKQRHCTRTIRSCDTCQRHASPSPCPGYTQFQGLARTMQDPLPMGRGGGRALAFLKGHQFRWIRRTHFRDKKLERERNASVWIKIEWSGCSDMGAAQWIRTDLQWVEIPPLK
jgi:hypothetical protein